MKSLNAVQHENSREKLASTRLNKYFHFELFLDFDSRNFLSHWNLKNRNAFREWLGISMWIERDL